MLESLAGFDVRDGDPVAPHHLAAAVTAAPLQYADGSRQWFLASGLTSFVANGHPTEGEWSVDDQSRFSSFWPPTYRATYDVTWLVTRGQITGLRFIDRRTGDLYDGHYDLNA